jgi:hypothetical protein
MKVLISESGIGPRCLTPKSGEYLNRRDSRYQGFRDSGIQEFRRQA